MRRFLIGTTALALMAVPATGATLMAGTGQSFPTLAEALRAAKEGDTVHLVAGTYFDCASVNRRNLVIEGEGEATVLTDRPCEGKGLLVVRGDGLTVRNLVLARARVPDRNGAGIRLEAQGLVLDQVVFDNDEVGVLAQQGGAGTIVVRDCVFRGGGVAGERPTSALSIGAVALLRVERSRFERFKGGQIVTAAAQTELVGNTIGGGIEPDGPAPVTSHGPLFMQDNAIELGPEPPSHNAAVVVTGDGATLDGNRLINRTGKPAILLLDWMSSSPVLGGNMVAAGDTLVSSEGSWRRRAGLLARGAVAGARGVAGDAKQVARRLLGR